MSTTKNSLPVRHQIIREKIAAMTIDEVIATATAFKSLDALVLDAMTTGYRPSCYTKPMGRANHHYERAEKALRIADEFDAAMYERGLRIRAFRANEAESLTRFSRV